jgi:hypothetical protein
MKPKEKSCKVCSKPFKPFKSTALVCSYQCAIKYAKRKEKAKKQKVRDNVVKYSKLMAEAKAAFQKWVRKRDEHLPCISCGKLTAEQWDGSHLFKSEVYRGVIFHPWNVNRACSYCNRWLDGNLIPYRKELINRIGLDKVELLEQEANQTRQRKWSRDELVEIRDEFKQRLKLMK